MYEIDDGQLIDLVRLNPLIYDRKQPLYKSKAAIEMVFKTIAKKLGNGVDGPACETRWHLLRDRYGKELRARKLAPSAISTWAYFGDMRFLKEHIRPRRRNKITIRSIEGSNKETSTSPKNVPWDFMQSVFVETQDVGITETDQNSSASVEGTTHQIMTTDILEESTPNIKGESAQGRPAEKHKINERGDQASDFQKNKRKCISRDVEVMSSCVSSTCKHLTSYLNNKRHAEDEVELFVRSIGVSLRQVKDVKIKREIQIKMLTLLAEYGV